MNGEELQLVNENIEFIKWLLVAFLVLFSVLLVAIIGGIAFMAKVGGEVLKPTKNFRRIGQEHLEKDEINDLIELCEEKLETHPNHDLANWFLALGYYHKGKLHDAKRAFLKTEEFRPSWKEEHIDPYLREIEKKLKNSKPEIIK